MKRPNDGYAVTVYGDFIWQIRYTDARTGERKEYMNIAFATEASAKSELNAIKKQIKKMKALGYYLNRTTDYQVNYVCTVGKNFRIVKKKRTWKK